MRVPTVPALAFVAAGLIAVAGCGSTIQAPGGIPGEELAMGELPTSPGAAIGQEDVLGSADSATKNAPGDPSSAPSDTLPGEVPGRGPTGSTRVPAAGVSGRGFDAKSITVGFVAVTGGEAFANALGVSGASEGDVPAQYAAVADHINRQGGVAGRKLILVKHEVDMATAVNEPDRTSAEVCAAFTQDRKVFAVILSVPPLASMRSCLAKANTPLIAGGNFNIGQPAYDRSPDLLYSPGTITTDRAIKLLVDSLMARKFFSSWDTVRGAPGQAPVKLGLLYAENPDAQYTAAAYKRELAARGLKITATVSYASNLQAAMSATQGAILKFKSQGITHVVGASVFFLQGAERQGYRPRYVIPPSIGRGYAANSPTAQMKGSMTVGWRPPSDVEAAQDPGDVSKAETLCKQVMKAKGQRYETSRPTLSSMVSVCDVTFVLRDALNGQSALSNAVLRAGVERLGSRWQSSQTWVSTFSPRMHASAAAVRDVAFDAGCSCMKYTSTRNRAG